MDIKLIGNTIDKIKELEIREYHTYRLIGKFYQRMDNSLQDSLTEEADSYKTEIKKYKKMLKKLVLEKDDE